MPDEDLSPPPEAETEETREPPEEREESVYPFMDAAAAGDASVTIRAGWADDEGGEPVEFVVKYTGGVGSPAAKTAYEAALEWYRDTLSMLMQQEQPE